MRKEKQKNKSKGKKKKKTNSAWLRLILPKFIGNINCARADKASYSRILIGSSL